MPENQSKVTINQREFSHTQRGLAFGKFHFLAQLISNQKESEREVENSLISLIHSLLIFLVLLHFPPTDNEQQRRLCRLSTALV